MNRLLVVSVAAVMLSASGALLAGADDKDTHVMHSKEMKNTAGVKDGEKMENAGSGSGGSAGEHSNQIDDGTAEPGDTHSVHSKQMKSDAGVKDGEKMSNASVGAASQKGQHSHGEKGKAADKDTHAVHSKAMKNDSGVKDGEKMESAP